MRSVPQGGATGLHETSERESKEFAFGFVSSCKYYLIVKMYVIMSKAGAFILAQIKMDFYAYGS